MLQAAAKRLSKKKKRVLHRMGVGARGSGSENTGNAGAAAAAAAVGQATTVSTAERTVATNLEAVRDALKTVNQRISGVQYFTRHRPPKLPRITVDQLMTTTTTTTTTASGGGGGGGDRFFEGRLPFVLVPENVTAPRVLMNEAELGLDYVAKTFANSIVDVYPNNMDHPVCARVQAVHMRACVRACVRKRVSCMFWWAT